MKPTHGARQKARWSTADKKTRRPIAGTRGAQSRGDDRSDRPRRTEGEDRPRRYDRDDRGPRDARRDDRPSFRRDDRSGFRRDDRRDERGGFASRERGFDGGQGRDRGYDRDRPRSYGSSDRGYGDRPRYEDRGRSGGYGDRQRSYGDRDRSFGDRELSGGYGDRQRGGYGDRDRSERSGGYGDRQRSYGDRPRFDRGSRGGYDDRRSGGYGRDRDQRGGGHYTEQARRLAGDFDRRSDRYSAPRQDERAQAEPQAPVEVAADNGFAALGLPTAMVERLARDGITSPFPIQQATIPDALSGRDVLGRGQTGSGKTLSFGLPMLTRLSQDGKKARPGEVRSIVLVPTRELAMQVSDALQPLVHVLGLRHKLVAGGMPYAPQFDALERGLDVLVATPGRLIDLIERGAADLSKVEIVVLDEADHMAQMGFLEAITEILDKCPAGGQRLLFSATLDRGIDTVVEKYLVDPVTHATDPHAASVTTMEHHVLLIDPMHKKVITAEVANRPGRTVVFVRTKLGADRVALQLREQGVWAAALHGGLSQSQRNRVLEAFRDGSLPVLVATDVAARGIHVDDVSVVLQVDPPADHKDYLHRSGRTARAGEKGTVVTLALPHQKRQMERLVGEAGLEISAVKAAPGDEVLTDVGARRTSGEAIPEARYRRLVEGEPRPHRAPRRGGAGYSERGGRSGFRGGSRGGRFERGDRGQGRGRDRYSDRGGYRD